MSPTAALHRDPREPSCPPAKMSAAETSAAEAVCSAAIREVLDEVQSLVAPLWPLKDYVAVNPFLGLAEQPFLAARNTLRGVRDCELLMPADYFRQRIAKGALTTDDLQTALRQCRQEYPALYADLTVDELLSRLEPDPNECRKTPGEHIYRTVAEAADQTRGTAWSPAIIREISRHCAAHYDEGQAMWSSPWKGCSLYEAWRETAQLDRRLEKLGVGNFRRFVAGLPRDPSAAIAAMLARLHVPPAARRGFLLCQLLSVAGWSSYVKYRVRDAELEGRRDDDLIGLLAIRLAYDCGLVAADLVGEDLVGEDLVGEGRALCPVGSEPDGPEQNGPGQNDSGQNDSGQNGPSVDLPVDRAGSARYLLQVAAEIAYRRTLCIALKRRSGASSAPSERTAVHMVFCIDVRSEPLRRHLESQSSGIETWGFAGFFGLPVEYVPLGSTAGSAQCPALIKPGCRVREGLRGVGPEFEANVRERRRVLRTGLRIFKSFQMSASSCFSFVETLGLSYCGKLLADSFGLTRAADHARFDGVPVQDRPRLGPVLPLQGEDGWDLDRRITLAHGMLTNLGLTDGFGRIVVICGHASQTVNNPYKASLNCGACGGQSGEPNARLAAALLNEFPVRQGLRQRGVEIPEDTWFVPAVHNTTTDELEFLDRDVLPSSHVAEFQQLRRWAGQAARQTRQERAARTGAASSDELIRRGRDWSEVRPEWGLAGNAAFVVAPRARTSTLPLDGRTFMHSYDFRRDPGFAILESIMTAPMIVTSWINLQYYASAVDPRNFGSGNKVLHNVVGQLGILEGNGGDLMAGLPWQSVHDGTRLQHEPLRLLVVIEAPRAAIDGILAKHPAVRQLAEHGWLTLLAIDEERHYWRSAGGDWREECGLRVRPGVVVESRQSEDATGRHSSKRLAGRRGLAVFGELRPNAEVAAAEAGDSGPPRLRPPRGKSRR